LSGPHPQLYANASSPVEGLVGRLDVPKSPDDLEALKEEQGRRRPGATTPPAARPRHSAAADRFSPAASGPDEQQVTPLNTL
jgi:hypothetical protein